MSGYDIFLSDGDLLTTVNVKTVDVQQNSALYLIGQGVPDYGTMVAQDFVWLMEHFSKATPPVNPLIGQLWHDPVHDRLNVFSTSRTWHALSTPESASDAQFDMLPAATNIDFSVAHSVSIFTVPDNSKRYCASSLILVPNGTPAANTAPVINLSITGGGDLLAATTLQVVGADQYQRIPISGTPRMATSTHPAITLNITTAAAGGNLHYDAYLFGFTV